LIKRSKTYTGLLPFGRGINDGLSDTLRQYNWGCVNIHRKGDQAKENGGELNHLEIFLEYLKVKEGWKKQDDERELARPEADNAAPGWRKLKNKGRKRRDDDDGRLGRCLYRIREQWNGGTGAMSL